MFLNYKYLIFTSIIIILPPICTWKYLFSYWRRKKEQYNEKVLFYKRHNNCVITFQPNKGLHGWPPFSRRRFTFQKLFLNLLAEQYEPITYFIKSARKTLDISMMCLNSDTIHAELLQAALRGVQIRILLNFKHSNDLGKSINLLQKAGRVKFQLFISKDLNSIMHNKYLIKDYDNLNNTGFVCMGSMNLTKNSLLKNYESFIFLSNFNVVEAFYKSFEDCWNTICLDNSGLINKTILNEIIWQNKI